MSLTVNECPLLAESGHWLTVNMHAYARYANDRFWPKADIRTESKFQFLNVRFGGKSGRSAPRWMPSNAYMRVESGRG